MRTTTGKRRRLTHAELLARMPRAFRPRLASDQVRDLAMCHLVNLDAIARGEADQSTLMQWTGGVLTWWRVAQGLQRGVAEMQQQLELATSVTQRFGRTGRVAFSGPEYQLAKAGVDVMDQLAEIVDRPTAIAAAEWSEAKINTLAQSERAA